MATQSWRSAEQRSATQSWGSAERRPSPGRPGCVPRDRLGGWNAVLCRSLTKRSACFLCLPVDHPPMEPSQFVSVVPKYPDKMGFDEVGKVFMCVCVHGTYVQACIKHASVFIPKHKLSVPQRACGWPTLAAGKAPGSWGTSPGFCCAQFSSLGKGASWGQCLNHRVTNKLLFSGENKFDIFF